jgi:hypothetical protein
LECGAQRRFGSIPAPFDRVKVGEEVEPPVGRYGVRAATVQSGASRGHAGTRPISARRPPHNGEPLAEAARDLGRPREKFGADVFPAVRPAL